MANNGHSDTHTLITSKIAAINARVSQNEDLIRRAEAAEVPASMDALLHRIEMFGRAKHDEGYYRDGDDLKSLNRERAAADLAEIRAMLAALKAQQPAPVDADEIERLTREIAELKADRDSWIEQASQRAQETVEAMQQVEAYRLRCEALHSAPREPLTDEQIANAARWRYWRNYWPALCRMEVARFAGLDLRTTYVQDPAGMDRVTDEAMTRRATTAALMRPARSEHGIEVRRGP